MSAAKSASDAVKSVPDVATLILARLAGAVGCAVASTAPDRLAIAEDS
jgi:hypothetical protein